MPTLERGRCSFSPFDTLAMRLAIAVDRALIDVVFGLESLDFVAQEFLSQQCTTRILFIRFQIRFQTDFNPHCQILKGQRERAKADHLWHHNSGVVVEYIPVSIPC